MEIHGPRAFSVNGNIGSVAECLGSVLPSEGVRGSIRIFFLSCVVQKRVLAKSRSAAASPWAHANAGYPGRSLNSNFPEVNCWRKSVGIRERMGLKH